VSNAEIDLTFHHVGVACTDIVAEIARLSPLGYVVEGVEFNDSLQGVRGVFLTGQAPRLELLEPLDGIKRGVLAPWLEKDIKLYHLAYETRSLTASIERLRRERAKLIVSPVPAVAFGGRKVAFLMLPNRMLIELIALD
jgi:methylmalonyl-CoA/ethylmalonyl-CoA epimerase